MVQKKLFALLVPGMYGSFTGLTSHLKEQSVEVWSAQNCAETDISCKLALMRMIARQTLRPSTQATDSMGCVTLILGAERAQHVQSHALALVTAQNHDPDFRGEALALGAADNLHHRAVTGDFARAIRWLHEGAEQ